MIRMVLMQTKDTISRVVTDTMMNRRLYPSQLNLDLANRQLADITMQIPTTPTNTRAGIMKAMRMPTMVNIKMNIIMTSNMTTKERLLLVSTRKPSDEGIPRRIRRLSAISQ
jgi:hypothetical protein